jgi:hypothetical protein
VARAPLGARNLHESALRLCRTLTVHPDLSPLPADLSVHLTCTPSADELEFTGSMLGVAWLRPGSEVTVWRPGEVTRSALQEHFERGDDLVIITGEVCGVPNTDGAVDAQLEMSNVRLVIGDGFRRAAVSHLWSAGDARLRARLKQVVLKIINELR